jgi:hypothetical protein
MGKHQRNLPDTLLSQSFGVSNNPALSKRPAMVAAKKGTLRETPPAKLGRTKFGPAPQRVLKTKSRMAAREKRKLTKPKDEGEEIVNETKRIRLVRRKSLANISILEMDIASGEITAGTATRGRKEGRENPHFSCRRKINR